MYRIRLQAHHGPAEAKSSGSDTSVASGSFINATTTPTTGMQFESIQFQGHGVVLREVGYDMARLWHKYYKKADVLLFVVDAANRAQLAQASVELYRILEHPSAKSKPLILLFNKIDQSLCMDIETVRQFIHVAELRKVHKVCRQSLCSQVNGHSHNFDFSRLTVWLYLWVSGTGI